MPQFFTVYHRSSRSKARLGEIHTDHGVIQTPAFVPVATKGTLKGIPPQFVKHIGIQLAFVNTYHLVVHPGTEIIKKAGGIHTFARLPLPLMSDSGGFQVFSLAKNVRKARIHGDEEPLVVRITEDGVVFRSTFDGAMIEFTPEKSIEYQQQIGADILMAFDQVTDYASDYNYTKKAMERTHDWLKRCVQQIKHDKSSVNKHQSLYGIIQGGAFKDLRQQSAEFTSQQPVAGIAIGSVANGGETKKQVREQVGFITNYLPEAKPVHLLGIGHADDILELVKHGIDTFDCVEPTRMARMGKLYEMTTNKKFDPFWQELDITRNEYKFNLESVTHGCQCYVCQNFTKAYLHHLFKQKELLGYTLSTYHNLFVMEQLMRTIRDLISQNLI